MSIHVKVILKVLPGKTSRRTSNGITKGGAGHRIKQRFAAGTLAHGSPGCWLLGVKAPGVGMRKW